MTPLDLCDEHECWPVKRGVAVERTPSELANALELLLMHSRELHFVDRYYDGGRERNVVIGECIDRIRLRGLRPVKICVHTAVTATREHIESRARWLLSRLPSGSELRVKVWKQIDGREGFYARYLMSERAGVRVDWGFSEGEPGMTTDVELMDADLRDKRWREFQSATSPYRLVHDILITPGT
jgi:hypothetical protein